MAIKSDRCSPPSVKRGATTLCTTMDATKNAKTVHTGPTPCTKYVSGR